MSNYPVRRTREDTFNYTPRDDPDVVQPSHSVTQQHFQHTSPYNYQQQQPPPPPPHHHSHPPPQSHQYYQPSQSHPQHFQQGNYHRPPPQDYYQPPHEQHSTHPSSRNQLPVNRTPANFDPPSRIMNSNYDGINHDVPPQDSIAGRYSEQGYQHNSGTNPGGYGSSNYRYTGQTAPSYHSYGEAGSIKPSFGQPRPPTNSSDTPLRDDEYQNSTFVNNNSGTNSPDGVVSRDSQVYGNSKTSTLTHKSKVLKYGSKSSSSAMNQYSHRSHQEKSLYHLQDMKSNHQLPPSDMRSEPEGNHYQYQQHQQHHNTWQSTRDLRRKHQDHSTTYSYRSPSESLSSLDLNQQNLPYDAGHANTSFGNGVPSVDNMSTLSNGKNSQAETDDDSVDLSAHDFILWAKMQDPYELSEALSREPALMTKKGAGGDTLLHASADVGNISLVDFLLKNMPVHESKELLRTYNSDGFEPLHVATSSRMLHVIKKLVKFDSDLPKRKTANGSTVLHVAVTANASVPMIQYLAEILGPDDVWATDGTGSTPLHLACMEGNIELMNALLELEGADVNLVDGQGQSCLHISIILGHFLMAKALLSKEHPYKPAIEQTGSQNNTSLHYACSNQHYNLVKLLLEHGANVNAKNKMKLTPSELGNDEIIDLIFANKEKYLPKKVSSVQNQRKNSNSEIDSSDEEECDSEEDNEEDSNDSEDDDEDDVQGGDIADSKTKSSDDDLFKNAKLGRISDMEKIIGRKEDLKRNVNKIRDSESKATLLHCASKHGHLDVAQYLVEGAGALVDLKDEYGMTPLHYAVEAEQLLVVRYLVKYCGAKLDIKDNAGNLAIDMADEDDAEDDDNVEEICRIIKKSLSKPPSKRKLVKLPVVDKNLP